MFIAILLGLRISINILAAAAVIVFYKKENRATTLGYDCVKRKLLQGLAVLKYDDFTAHFTAKARHKF
ncbi:MAG: hypothetical protein RR873_03450 [Christensenella sp.]